MRKFFLSHVHDYFSSVLEFVVNNSSSENGTDLSRFVLDDTPCDVFFFFYYLSFIFRRRDIKYRSPLISSGRNLINFASASNFVTRYTKLEHVDQSCFLVYSICISSTSKDNVDECFKFLQESITKDWFIFLLNYSNRGKLIYREWTIRKAIESYQSTFFNHSSCLII